MLTSERPSAPAAATARATSAMSQVPARASRRAAASSRRGRRRRSRRPTRPPRRRSGTRGSARSRRRRRARRTSRRTRAARSRRPRPRAARRARAAAAASSARKRSRPGFASPIEFSIPCVGLGDPDGRVALARQRRDRLRHEGVELPRDVAARSARRGSRTAFSSMHRTGPFDAEALQLAVDLDGAAVAGAVAAGHRRLPGELRARARARATASSIGSGPAREHVVARRHAAR